jgi:hypothetical protein
MNSQQREPRTTAGKTEPAASDVNHRKLNSCTDPGVEGHKNNQHGAHARSGQRSLVATRISIRTFEGELAAFATLNRCLRRPINLASLFAVPRLASLVQDARPVEDEAWLVQNAARLIQNEVSLVFRR